VALGGSECERGRMALTMVGGFLYFLVCLRDPPGLVDLLAVDHEAFIDALTARDPMVAAGDLLAHQLLAGQVSFSGGPG
jgi:hypothetical protein